MGGGRYMVLAFVTAATILVDQVSKAYIMRTMRLHESIPIIPGFFSLTYIRNPGAAFGILATSSTGFRLLFFGFTSLFALVLLGTIFFRLRQDDWVGQLSIAGILGGAIGNLVDRVALGAVVDFLHFHAGRWSFPAFNLADSAITLGVAALLVDSLFGRRESPK